MDLYPFYVYKHIRQLVCARTLTRTLSVPLSLSLSGAFYNPASWTAKPWSYPSLPFQALLRQFR